MLRISTSTFKALHRRKLDFRTVAKLLDVTERHAKEIVEGAVDVDARECAIIRLACNVTPTRLSLILREFERERDWRVCAGFPNYEVSTEGLVRRLRYAHGAQPGHVLKPRLGRFGHLYVNLSHNGNRKKIAVHRLVCEAFNELQPTPSHIVCHRNDIPDDNRPQNLYWGTHQQNADDRRRNGIERSFGRNLTRSGQLYGPPTKRQLQIRYKKQMLTRLSK